MIDWKNSKEERPEAGQSCFITAAHDGFSSFPILGPMMFQETDSGGMFIDLFATPEAGHAYPINDPEMPDIHWCPQEQINLPDAVKKS